jgi:hypothetical protein
MERRKELARLLTRRASITLEPVQLATMARTPFVKTNLSIVLASHRHRLNSSATTTPVQSAAWTIPKEFFLADHSKQRERRVQRLFTGMTSTVPMTRLQRTHSIPAAPGIPAQREAFPLTF